MAASVYRERDRCAGCKAYVDARRAHLSAAGHLCFPCYANEAQALRDRELRRADDVEGMLGSVTGLAAGLAILAIAFWSDGAVASLFVAGCFGFVAASVARVVRRSPTDLRARVVRAVAIAGAGFATIGGGAMLLHLVQR